MGHTLCAQAPAASPESLRAAHRDTQMGPKAGGQALLPPLLRGHLVSQVTQREQGKLLAFSAFAFLWLTLTGPQAWQLSWVPRRDLNPGALVAPAVLVPKSPLVTP